MIYILYASAPARFNAPANGNLPNRHVKKERSLFGLLEWQNDNISRNSNTYYELSASIQRRSCCVRSSWVVTILLKCHTRTQYIISFTVAEQPINKEITGSHEDQYYPGSRECDLKTLPFTSVSTHQLPMFGQRQPSSGALKLVHQISPFSFDFIDDWEQ